ncbi:hypothetical protein D6D22_00619 [Aureobasidium pullulans]|uniref:BTB domain-containing protein n=1 Tax=Aureobasidium pullulans TaxID=5580 RepID=A0A4S8YI84_AURPU|nr:hypothetical protein D6D22_00619 [Aureobasidium pullulans]
MPAERNKSTWSEGVISDILRSSTETIELQSDPSKNKEVFRSTVNKELLCFFSPYYVAAIKGHFSEAKQKLFTLDLNYAQTRAFTNWLCTGRLTHTNTSAWAVDKKCLFGLYIFADMTDNLALRRAVMSHLASELTGTTDRPHPSEYGKLLPQLPKDSPLIPFCLDATVVDLELNEYLGIQTMKASRGVELLRWLPEDRVRYIMEGVNERRKRIDHEDKWHFLWEVNACDYHEHENEEEWSLTCGNVTPNLKEPRPECYKHAGAQLLEYLKKPRERPVPRYIQRARRRQLHNHDQE